jgi:hypothetical protein
METNNEQLQSTRETYEATDLSKKNMPNSCINIFFNRLARGYHVPILKFHGFGTLCPKLSTHNNLRERLHENQTCKDLLVECKQ